MFVVYSLQEMMLLEYLS